MARDLKKGKTGSDVLQLQKDLQYVGYYLDGKLDGVFGKVTKKAVKAFQKANGLKVDGIVGPKTRAALAKKVAEKKAKAKPTAKSSKPKGQNLTVETGRWSGNRFFVSPSLIYSFHTLTLKGSSELKSSKDNKKGYVKRKGPNPTEVTFTISLNAFAGNNVRGVAESFLEKAREGAKDYFYVGGRKLTPCKLMLTDASVKNIEIGHNGIWTRADIQLTMKQASKNEKRSTFKPKIEIGLKFSGTPASATNVIKDAKKASGYKVGTLIIRK